ncbi:DUF4297 domain-containing protein [Vibrio parahaemolyticus]
MSSTVMDQSDSGGVAALKGFTYQNVAAAYYVLQMLRDKSLIAVRCEVIDDFDLIYNNRVEYVQVKTKDGDSKWTIEEFAEADTKVVKPTGRQTKDQTISLRDSILHKSLLCDKETLSGYFRIITLRDVNDYVKLLKVPLKDRAEKQEARNELLNRLKRVTKRNIPLKEQPFVSPNGNDVEYWLDHAEWDVIPSKELLILQCANQIQQTALGKSIYFNDFDDPKRILASLLDELINKAAESRVLKSESDKTCHRQTFLSWFNKELSRYGSTVNKNIKVYATGTKKLQTVLSSFVQSSNLYCPIEFPGGKDCTGLHGTYHRGKYNYKNIAKSLYSWFDEVLLYPSELANNSQSNITEKFELFSQRYLNTTDDLNKFIAKVLLHSSVRSIHKSQPIPASLHIENHNELHFDNVHIVLNDPEPDQLIMGFSYLISKYTHTSIKQIIDDFDNLLESEAFSAQQARVLTIKENSYLYEHDIDEILQSTSSLDDNLDRFQFAFFIGYESENIKCNDDKMAKDYLENLKIEVTQHFQDLINQLIEKDSFFKKLHIQVYIYPIPSLNNLLSAVDSEVKSKWTF